MTFNSLQQRRFEPFVATIATQPWSHSDSSLLVVQCVSTELLHSYNSTFLRQTFFSQPKWDIKNIPRSHSMWRLRSSSYFSRGLDLKPQVISAPRFPLILPMIVHPIGRVVILKDTKLWFKQQQEVVDSQEAASMLLQSNDWKYKITNADYQIGIWFGKSRIQL